jgi:hypothetical protein
MTVRTVTDPCPWNFLSVIVVRGKASYCKSRPTPLINRFFCRLWRSSHVWTRSRGHNHSNARPSKVCSVIFVKNIIFIFIRFVLLYFYNAFGAYMILLLFLDLSYLLLLWRFWPVYTAICYNFINYLLLSILFYCKRCEYNRINQSVTQSNQWWFDCETRKQA